MRRPVSVLAERHGDSLYRAAFAVCRNPQDAEDVVQETIIKVWNRREEWDQIENIEAFCLTVC